jgi:hypothetical protein
MKAASRALSYFSWLNSVSWSKTFVFWLIFFTKKSLGSQGKKFVLGKNRHISILDS